MNERMRKGKSAIKEAVVVEEDFRIQMVGGSAAAFDLWEAEILPALLYNSETWVDITPKNVDNHAGVRTPSA